MKENRLSSNHDLFTVHDYLLVLISISLEIISPCTNIWIVIEMYSLAHLSIEQIAGESSRVFSQHWSTKVGII